MGDRGNIVLREHDGGTLYLYTHWDGYELPQIVARGLDRGRDRWDDEPYLARILFCTLVEDDVKGETGYGISTTQGDGGTEVYVTPGNPGKVEFKGDEYTFEQFVQEYAAGSDE